MRVTCFHIYSNKWSVGQAFHTDMCTDSRTESQTRDNQFIYLYLLIIMNYKYKGKKEKNVYIVYRVT